MLYIVMPQNKKAKYQPHPYRNSFVDCTALEIYETVYRQTSQSVAAGLLVIISKTATLHPKQAIGNNSFKSILGLPENCRSLVLIKDGAYFGNTFLK